jgi:predicted membrane chloride channel (bestrophin family)
MNKEKQRIAIAEACEIVSRDQWGPLYKTARGVLRDCPDYLNDLNAMHEAEKVLTYKQSFTYTNNLEARTQTTTGLGRTIIGRTFQTIQSTAAQRAEAFLRTVGKWEDDK